MTHTIVRFLESKKLTNLIAALALGYLIFCSVCPPLHGQTAGPAQDQLILTAPAPVAVSGAAAGYTGVGGNYTYYYWVVTRFQGGSSVPAGPLKVSNAVTPLDGTHFVTLTWYPAVGMSVTYDVLRTTTPSLPTSCTCLLGNVSTTTYTDNGGGLSAYTLAGFPYAGSKMSFTLNARDYAVPRLQILSPNGTTYTSNAVMATPPTTIFVVDGNRTDVYTEDGSTYTPFKKISTAVAAMTGTGPYGLVITPTPSAYTDTGTFTGPSATLTVYGNGSSWSITGSVTFPGVLHTYDMSITTTAGIVSTQTGTTRSTIQGGVITGNVTTSGFVHFRDTTLSSGIITIGAGSSVFLHSVVGGSRLVTTDATSVLFTADANLSSGSASALIDASAGGRLILNNSLFVNAGATTINCADGANSTATMNLFNGVVASGAVACGTAWTSVSKVIPRPSGTFIFPVPDAIDACVSASASQTTYTCTSSSVSTAYVTGMRVLWFPDLTNSGTTPTLNINALGAKTIVHQNGTALVAGEFTAASPVELYYDGTNWKTEWRFGMTSAGIPTFAAGGSADHAVCWKADGKTLGYCSVVVDASGVCGTCN